MMTIRDLIEWDRGKLDVRRIRATGTGLSRKLSAAHVQLAADMEQLLGGCLAPSPLVLSKTCLGQIACFAPIRRREFYQTIKMSGIPCVALADTEEIPEELACFGERHHLPIFSSTHDAYLLESRLLGLLREKIECTITVHGTLVDFAGSGLLITGESGIGKTRCAVQLMERGYRWVADDGVEIEKMQTGELCGRSCQTIAGLLELWPRGVVKAADVFPASSICPRTMVVMVLVLEKKISGAPGMSIGRRTILGVERPLIKMALAPGQNDLAGRVDAYFSGHLKRELLS